MTKHNPFRYFRTSPEIIRLAVMGDMSGHGLTCARGAVHLGAGQGSYPCGWGALGSFPHLCSIRIRTILTDNGKEFTDRLFGLRKRVATGRLKFDKLCAELNIEHRLTPPRSPQTNGRVERSNGRIEDVLQSHHFRSGEELDATLHRYVWLYNQQLPQSALDSKTPLQAMKDWHKLKPELFKKQPYFRPGCDT
jgi:transposase InsO family protein